MIDTAYETGYGTAHDTGSGADPVTGARAEVTLTVGLPAGALWDLLADVTRVGEWSPECLGARWLGGPAPATPAAIRAGDRFEGRNRYPDGSTVSVVCQVTEARRPGRFAWVVLDERADPERPGSLWCYDLTPDALPGRTVVRQSFVHGPGLTGAREAALRSPGALDGRLSQLRDGMRRTLLALARSAGATASVMGEDR
ncbi:MULTISPECIES: SRPBCC family protein [Streptomyces]|nr:MULTISPECIES: SRPBCC family protein [Streptomyces]